MSAKTNELNAALGRAGKIPGWVVKRLDTGAYRIASPTGNGLVPAHPTAEDCDKALTLLNQLGLQQDTRHRFVPVFKPAPQQLDLTTIVDTGTEPTDVPTATTTKPRPPRTKGSPLTKFVYPGQPQEAKLESLLPTAFIGMGRLLIPGVTVGQELAEAFYDLRADKVNRKLRKSNVNKFHGIMEENNFEHTHQGLAFNTNNELSDGQHRIASLLDLCETEPGATITVDITYNMPVETARAFDGGANRSNVDRLHVAGIEEAGKVAPLVRLLWLFEEAQKRSARSWKELPPMSESVLIAWSKEYGDDLVAAYHAVRVPLRGSSMNANVAAIAYYVAFQEWDDSPMLEFCEAVGEQTLQHKGTPQRALASWLRNNKIENRRVTQQLMLAMFLVAYNDFCAETPRAQMKWLPNAGMPLPYAPREVKPTKKIAKTK